MRISFLASAAIGILALGSTLQAAAIGINFSDGNSDLSPTTTAGFIPTAHYNNITYGLTSTGSAVLTDSDGTTIPTTFTASYNYISGAGKNGGSFANAGDNTLFTAYASSGGGSQQPPTLTFTDIPYSNYDVYVYVGADNTDRTGSVSLSNNGTTGAVNTTTYAYHGEGASSTFDFASPTSTDYANTILFSNNTAPDLGINYVATYGEGIYGVQIVAVPEPTSLALAGLGVFGLLRRRRALRLLAPKKPKPVFV